MAPNRRESVVNDSTATVADLKRLVQDFVTERDWEPFHDAKNLSTAIAIEAAELMEHFQWLRSEEMPAVVDDVEAMKEIRAELADITAFVLSFAMTMGIDLSSALAEKMKQNAIKYPIERFRGRFR